MASLRGISGKKPIVHGLSVCLLVFTVFAVLTTKASADSTGPEILRISQTGTQSVLASDGLLVSPEGITTALPNSVFVTNSPSAAGNTGETIGVLRVDGETGAQSVLSQGGNLGVPYGIVRNFPDLLVMDAATGVVGVNPNTGTQTIFSKGGLFNQVGNPLYGTLANGAVYVTAWQSCYGVGNGGAKVIAVNLITRAQSTVANLDDCSSPQGIVIDNTGNVVVALSATNTNKASGGPAEIVRIVGGKTSRITRGGMLRNPLGMTKAIDGSLLVADSEAFGGKGGIIRIDPNSGSQSTFARGGSIDGPNDIARSTFGSNFYVSELGAGPTSRITGRTRQRMRSTRRIRFRVRCPHAACGTKIRGKIRGLGRRSISLNSNNAVGGLLKINQNKRFQINLSRRQIRIVRRAIRAGRRVTVRITNVAWDDRTDQNGRKARRNFRLVG